MFFKVSAPVLLLAASLLASPILGSVIPAQARESLHERDDASVDTLETVRRALHRRTEQVVLNSLDGQAGFPCVTWAEGVPCTQFDVLVIGGGPSGLQAAMSLGRLKRSVMILDSGSYRNDPTYQAHDVIGLDGLPPAEIRARARNNLREYPNVKYRRYTVESMKSINNATYFEATTTQGLVFTARKVVLATGVKDVLPDIPGIEGIWGAAGFWCPWCDGWEHRDGPLAVLAMENAGEALAVHKLNPEATVYTNGASSATSERMQAMLNAEGINIETKKISSVALRDARPEARHTSPLVMTFDDGTTKVYKGFLFTTRRPLHSPSLTWELEVEVTYNPGPLIKRIDYTGQTNQFGVWAVGDAASTSKSVANAIYSGKSAAVPIVFRLAYEEALAKSHQNWRY